MEAYVKTISIRVTEEELNIIHNMCSVKGIKSPGRLIKRLVSAELEAFKQTYKPNVLGE